MDPLLKYSSKRSLWPRPKMFITHVFYPDLVYALCGLCYGWCSLVYLVFACLPSHSFPVCVISSSTCTVYPPPPQKTKKTKQTQKQRLMQTQDMWAKVDYTPTRSLCERTASTVWVLCHNNIRALSQRNLQTYVSRICLTLRAILFIQPQEYHTQAYVWCDDIYSGMSLFI